MAVVYSVVIRLCIMPLSHWCVFCAVTEPIESPKSKDKVTWKGRMVRHFRRHGSASSTPGYVTAKMSDVTGTFGVPLELCVSSTFSPVCVNCAYFGKSFIRLTRTAILNYSKTTRNILFIDISASHRKPSSGPTPT